MLDIVEINQFLFQFLFPEYPVEIHDQLLQCAGLAADFIYIRQLVLYSIAKIRFFHGFEGVFRLVPESTYLILDQGILFLLILARP